MPASDKNLFDQFAVLGIQTTTVRHSPMFTVEDGEKLLVDVPGGYCKTLFLKNKNGNHWLVVMLGNIRLDMKMLQKKLGSSRLSFAKPDLMREKLLNYHPLRNDATTTITASDLLKFIYAMEHKPTILDM